MTVPHRATVVALAGRRIDAEQASPPRFPAIAVARVKADLLALYRERSVEAVVASAACGADLVALSAARESGVRFRIVLPFAPELFRDTSVVDRPGAWGELYDELIALAKARNDLVVLGGNADQADEAYASATGCILEEAQALSRELAASTLAVAVWDGEARRGPDATKDFMDRAARLGIEVRSVSTLPDPAAFGA